MDQRRRYFAFFPSAAEYPGGESYRGFLKQIREEALATCSPTERVVLESIVSQFLTAKPYQSTPLKGPGRKWTKALALDILRDKLHDRDVDQGRNLFHATSCAKCHRLNGEGGAIGPDLSTVTRKFSLSDLLDSILEPNKVISDQYGSHLVRTVDGRTVTGRVVEIGDEVHVYTDDPNAPPRVIDLSDVEAMLVSKLSQMPGGLVDTLNSEELKDLIAYLMSVDD